MLSSRIGLGIAGACVAVGLYVAVFGGWQRFVSPGYAGMEVAEAELDTFVIPLPTEPELTAADPAYAFQQRDPATRFGQPSTDGPAPLPTPGMRDTNLPDLGTAALPLPGGGDGSQRVVFVLDHSGSMWEGFGTATRLEHARAELAGLIRGLDPGVRFNVVVYGREWRLFRAEPIRATEAGKGEALAFVGQRHQTGGQTNLSAALRRTLAMSPDAIVLLTDGEFNAGADELLSDAAELRARHRSKAALSVVAFAPRAGTNAKMILQRLCAENGGRYVDWHPRIGRGSSPLASTPLPELPLAN